MTASAITRPTSISCTPPRSQRQPVPSPLAAYSRRAQPHSASRPQPITLPPSTSSRSGTPPGQAKRAPVTATRPARPAVARRGSSTHADDQKRQRGICRVGCGRAKVRGEPGVSFLGLGGTA
jgi:hypothetical protein